MSVIEVLIHLIFGNLFEIFAIAYTISKVKDLKITKILLASTIGYLLGGTVTGFNYNLQYISYIIITFMIYLMCKVSCRNKFKIIDVFVIYYVLMILCFSSLVPILLFSNYYLQFIVSRLVILTFLLNIPRLNLRDKYIKYWKFWDRRKGNKIKAITVRNLSLITLNILYVVITHLVIIYLT